MAYTDTQKKLYINGAAGPGTTIETAATSPIGTYYLADNPQHYEIQRTNNFVFYVEGLKSGITKSAELDPDSYGVQNKWAQDNADDVIRISCSKAFVPHFTQSVIEVKRGNNTLKFAGTPTFGEGSIALYDFIGAGTKDVLYAWQQLSYNTRNEKVGLVTDYKKDAYLLEYTPDYQLVRTWKLYGCWISGLSEDDYNWESNEKHNINATIQYDKAVIDTSDVE